MNERNKVIYLKQPKGSAHVQFKTEDMALDALDLNNQ